MADTLISIDLGTTSCKTVLFDTDFEVVATASRGYGTEYPQPSWAEQQADSWWGALLETTQEVLEKSGVAPSQVIAVGVDAFSTTVLPVDREGRPLRPGLIWMDRRATSEAAWIAEHLGDELRSISGNFSDAGNIAPKLLWLKKHEPDVYAKTHQFLHANAYLVYKLTGCYSMDASETGLSQLCDSATGRYSETLIEGCGLDRSKLPEIFQCTDTVGTVTELAARATGLAAGTPVIAGAMDNIAAGLGAGVYQPGEVFISGGTVTTNNVCLGEPRYHPSLHIYPHIVPGTWITSGGVDFGGAGLKWFKELLGLGSWEEMDELAEASVCGKSSIIFVPYMVGQRCPVRNDHTTGVLLGLRPSTNRQDLARAFMEGTAYGSRHVLEIVEDQGIPIHEIRMTGGCTNTPVWPQIFADVIGKPIRIPGVVDLPPLGVAIAAARGVGAISSFEEGVRKIRIRSECDAASERHQYYTEMFSVFRSLYENIKHEYDGLSAIHNKYSVSPLETKS